MSFQSVCFHTKLEIVLFYDVIVGGVTAGLDQSHHRDPSFLPEADNAHDNIF